MQHSSLITSRSDSIVSPNSCLYKILETVVLQLLFCKHHICISIFFSSSCSFFIFPFSKCVCFSCTNRTYALLILFADMVMPMCGRPLQICSIIFLSQLWLVLFLIYVWIICDSCICDKEKQLNLFSMLFGGVVLPMFKGFGGQRRRNWIVNMFRLKFVATYGVSWEDCSHSELLIVVISPTQMSWQCSL